MFPQKKQTEMHIHTSGQTDRQTDRQTEDLENITKRAEYVCVYYISTNASICAEMCALFFLRN